MPSEKYASPHQRRENATVGRNIPRRRDCYICGSQQHLSFETMGPRRTNEKWIYIAIVHSSLVPKLKDNEGIRIFLTPEFGKQIEAKVCRMTIYFKNFDNNIFNSVDRLVAVTAQLNIPCLVTPELHELLTNSEDGEIDCSGGAHEERKVLPVYFETKEERIGEKTPPDRQAPERLREKTNEQRRKRRS
ncbi:CCHC-type domain-containing protein [Trichonephila clavata]|uniref:CCHC-type domain-containing protein n=1 Tax=Trichonephila clavata TaxID=2740835 RepID=A0A8X6H7I4_TRICU|nr:CCHC-type domain-containing protein [Trichonephila clavata]